MKSGLVAVLVLSLLLNGCLAYGVLDNGVTATHSQDEARHRTDQLRTIERLSPVLLEGTDRQALENAAKEEGLSVHEKVSGELLIENVGFEMAGDRLVSIDFLLND